MNLNQTINNKRGYVTNYGVSFGDPNKSFVTSDIVMALGSATVSNDSQVVEIETGIIVASFNSKDGAYVDPMYQEIVVKMG